MPEPVLCGCDACAPAQVVGSVLVALLYRTICLRLAAAPSDHPPHP